jgi:hypothetical protein
MLKMIPGNQSGMSGLMSFFTLNITDKSVNSNASHEIAATININLERALARIKKANLQ